MQLDQYQKMALSTAAPVGETYEYLAHGLVGEAGEFAGRIAKGVWKGDRTSGAYYADLALEYGDIAWMTAVILHRQGIHGRDAWDHPLAVPSEDMSAPLGVIMAEVGYMFRVYANNVTGYTLDGRRLWDLLETYCERLTHHTWADVLQMNVDKLASRAARGVLVGNGDHR